MFAIYHFLLIYRIGSTSVRSTCRIKERKRSLCDSRLGVYDRKIIGVYFNVLIKLKKYRAKKENELHRLLPWKTSKIFNGVQYFENIYQANVRIYNLR